ncbi:hypothetical protein [uncultured Ruegeria sp.]|uniref:hypothetical protein n=1 Tax=uncultured Ruegeria sp. TaxID=259304 RepID=UPI0026052926|nr:hypothetical protein [uncultured Ruegeria sp.]
MDLVFSLIVVTLGTACAFATKAKKWVLLLTIWVSVPIGILLSTKLGLYVAKLGDCQPSARAPIECIVRGYDVSDWMNGLVFSGYVFAFVGIPWLVIGAICIALYGILCAVKAWRD